MSSHIRDNYQAVYTKVPFDVQADDNDKAKSHGLVIVDVEPKLSQKFSERLPMSECPVHGNDMYERMIGHVSQQEDNEACSHRVVTAVRTDYPNAVDIIIDPEKKYGAARFLRAINADSKRPGQAEFIALRDLLVLAESMGLNRRAKYEFFLTKIPDFKGQALNSELFALKTGSRLYTLGVKTAEMVKLTITTEDTSMIHREHFFVVIGRESQEIPQDSADNSQSSIEEGGETFNIASPATFPETSFICDTRLCFYGSAKDYISIAGDQLGKMLAPDLEPESINWTGDSINWECVYRFQQKVPSRASAWCTCLKSALLGSEP